MIEISSNIDRLIKRSPWLWSYLAAATLAVVTAAFTRAGGGGALVTAALSFGAFFALAGIAQLYVITLGPGNIDLSIPSNINLSAAIAMQAMAGSDAMVIPGLIATLGIGVLVGTANFLLISALRIPPIIATLASSFVIQSIAIAVSHGYSVQPPAILRDFVHAKLSVFPWLAMLTAAIAALMAVVLHHTRFGRSITAIGQNRNAAVLVGIEIRRIEFSTYVVCACLAALCGALLAAFSGGSSLEMGNEYLLASIAVVVIGGTSISGGNSYIAGVWGASLFLFLLITMLNSFGTSAGLRLMLMGMIIVALVLLASGRHSAT